ncbi:MAG: YncE family protein [Chitinophagaceae bacterium]|nr:YncE family protein [Chitinophagaceae bacterium]
MHNKILATLILVVSMSMAGIAQKTYGIQKTFRIASLGGWDYLAINGKELYVSHGNQVNILDKTSGDSIGVVTNTNGVHGIAFVPQVNKGYTTNGRLNNVTVFDLTTHEVVQQIATGQNPDALVYDRFSKSIFVCNGRSNDLTVIDVASNKVTATIALGGKPETAVTDHAGKLYVNIEDKNEIVEVNTQTLTAKRHWPLGKAEAPTGLAFDINTKRLFAGCEKLLVVMDAANGTVITQIPIGDGCDGVVFDVATKTIFTSNGEGTMTVIKEEAANNFKVTETIITKPGARTITLDETTHQLYLPTAEFEPLAADAKKGDRPKMKPGTFQVLVVGKL